MKRKWLLVLTAVLLQSALWAQQFPRQVLSSAGNTSTAGSISLSWTVGQPGPVQSTDPASFYITQGYQQGDELYVSINGFVVANTSIKVYPNPSGGIFHLEGIMPSGGICNYMVVDINGKQVMQDYFNADALGNIQSYFDLSFLPGGIYNLKLYGGEGTKQYSCSYKLTLIK
jgi:hypothetical protein